MAETWKLIDDFPGYEVSNRGQVRSYYTCGHKRRIVGDPQRVLKPSMNGSGYLQVILYHGGVSAPAPIHRLVAATFLGSCQEGLEVNHKDGSLGNNRADNLEYVTHSENMRHARDVLGTILRGESHHRSKLTTKDVLAIRGEYAAGGVTQGELAKRYCITGSNVSCIVLKKSWRHLP